MAEIGSRIDIEELERVLEGIEQKYKSEEGVQLEILADHFITLFKDADIPFNKIVLDLPRSTVSFSSRIGLPLAATETFNQSWLTSC